MKPYNENWTSSIEVLVLPKVYHVANPLVRDNIYQTGLTPKQGNCYDSYEYPPAIFICNVPDISHSEMFDSTWDDDIWEIDVSKIDNVFYQDINFTTNHYCFTLNQIPPTALTLIKIGSGQNKFGC